MNRTFLSRKRKKKQNESMSFFFVLFIYQLETTKKNKTNHQYHLITITNVLSLSFPRV